MFICDVFYANVASLEYSDHGPSWHNDSFCFEMNCSGWLCGFFFLISMGHSFTIKVHGKIDYRGNHFEM